MSELRSLSYAGEKKNATVMKRMTEKREIDKMDLSENDKQIKGVCLGLGLVLLAAAFLSAAFWGGLEGLFEGWIRILISPCPLMTDYFQVGGVSGTFFNAAVCSLACLLIVVVSGAKATPSLLASYILVIAHCFYGMNFLNIWPCYIGVIIYYCCRKKDFRQYLHVAMFTMAFGPLVSEVLLRYPVGNDFLPGEIQITFLGIFLTVVVGLAAGMILPGMLEGALWMHKGYNLYNGGLAFGLVGCFLYAFLYKTMGIESPGPIEANNGFYDGTGETTWLLANGVFIAIFLAALIAGVLLNGKGLKNYQNLMKETGHFSNFADKYGMPLCLINMGIYGLMVLAYMNLVMLLTPGIAFTGPTVGAVFAAVTFFAVGQHPKNTWSIFLGYVVLFLFMALLCTLQGRELAWTLSAQGYINGVAFATGLAPIAGRYGWRWGVAAGIVSGAICTSTSAIHGGFMLFNGGFTAGITALIMVSVLEHHFPHMKVKGI